MEIKFLDGKSRITKKNHTSYRDKGQGIKFKMVSLGLAVVVIRAIVSHAFQGSGLIHRACVRYTVQIADNQGRPV